MPLTEAGFEATRTAEWLERIRNDLNNALGRDMDFARDSFAGSIALTMAAALGDLSELLQAVYDARDPNNATGVQLASLALAAPGITRNEPTASTQVVDLTGDAGKVIPAGRTIRGGGLRDADATEALWDLTEDVTLDGDGEGSGLFRCRTLGPVRNGSGDFEIVTTMAGWTGAVATGDAEDFDIGLARESDDLLRQRRQFSLAFGGSSSTASLRAKILEVAQIASCFVVENDTDEPLLVEGVTVPGHALAVYVHPDTIEAAQQTALARVLYDHTAAGIELIGDEEAEVTGLDQRNKTVRWSFVVPLLIDVEATVILEVGGVFEVVRLQVIERITAYGLAMGAGQDPIDLAIQAACADILGLRTLIVDFNPQTPNEDRDRTQSVIIYAGELAVFDVITVVEEALVP